jgi:large subunit ribosomal protein L23
MNLEPHHIIKSPVITEESQIQTRKGNQYTFRVNPKANKIQIREAIEAVFPSVHVVSVNTMNYSGKTKQQSGRAGGSKADWKKAVVTLRAGDKIELI